MRSKSKVNFKEIKNVLLKNKLYSDDFICNNRFEYKNIKFNSFNVVEGDIFVCIVGFKSDGHNYAEKAVENGAELLIVQKRLPIEINQIIVSDSRKACAVISIFINEIYFKDTKLIGITGTNGKTTTSFLIFKSLKSMGYSVGFIGTLGYWINEDFHSLSRTTPDIIELHQILKFMLNKKVRIIVMEVSSHSIALSRIYGLKFSIGMITNLSHEHLDFHKNMEEYSNTKFRFLETTLESEGKVVVNYDNKYIRKRISNKMLKISFSKGDIEIDEITYDLNESEFTLKFFKDKFKITTNLVGKYNIQNVAFAFTAIKLLNLGIDDNLIISSLAKIKTIPGRLQQYKNTNVFVDFAHTPDALENVLSTLRKLTSERLIVVIGAGGNRDREKRPLMTEICLKHADLVILTSDNPRTEQPEDIIREMFSNTNVNENIFIQTDREIAIKSALTILTENDVLLIAGKGHEDYQEINETKYHFNDMEMIDKYYNKRYFAPKNQEGCSTIELQIPIDSLYLEFLFDFKISTSKNFFSVSIDNRTIINNSIFFAIKGKKFDAHNFVKYIGKSSVAIIEDEHFSSENTILVDNVIDKFQLLSAKYSGLFSSKKIGITGSFGKTTTKEYLALILSSKGKILKTYLNENNHIGVPKTLYRTNSSHRYSIIELGSNHPGEINTLGKIVIPEIAIITSVGASHIQFFGTLENILKEKTSLLNYSKMKIINGDNELLFNYNKNAIYVGKNKRNNFTYKILEKMENLTRIKVEDSIFMLPTIIESKIEDAVLAIVCAKLEKYNDNDIQDQLKKDLEIPQRMEIINSKYRILIVDCYNANYDSMQAAIKFWKNYKSDLPHIAFLGDMLELGEEAAIYHKKIGYSISELSNNIFSVGIFSINYNARKHFSNVDELIENLNFVSIPNNAVILIKASHGIHLEKIIKRL